MLTALIAGSGVVIAAASTLALLLVAAAAPVTASGRRSRDGAVPLVAPRGSGFGDATAIVAASAARPVAAERTAPTPRLAVRGHRSIRPAARAAVHLAA